MKIVRKSTISYTGISISYKVPISRNLIYLFNHLTMIYLQLSIFERLNYFLLPINAKYTA